MTWLNYLLEANLYLAIFYGFYLLFLQKETFYGLNRAYLILSSIISFVIPFITVSGFNQLLNNQRELDLVSIDPKLGKPANSLSLISPEEIGTYIYLTVALYFSVRLFLSVYKIISLAIKAKRSRSGNIIYLELSDTQTAFSFFNLLFINPRSIGKTTIIKHELVHIQQRHSLDVLFFELLRILNWFNPVVWLVQKDIKLLHEYIADEVTTNNDVQKHEYAMFLIQNSFGVTSHYLTNQIFNSSILKRRINMLNRKRSAGRARLKILLTVPVLGGMLFASTVAFSKNYALIDLYPEQSGVRVAPAVVKQSIQEPVVQVTRFFVLNHKMDSKGKKIIKYDTRLVVINGSSTQPGEIMKVEGFDKMVELGAAKAKAKYGARGASGALEFTGKNTKTYGLREYVRFPPPMVTKVAPPPPPPPAEPSSIAPGVKGKTNSPKKGEIPFPPPKVAPMKKEVPPPPPPVEPKVLDTAAGEIL